MRKPLLKALIIFFLILTVFTACDHNVYMGEPERITPSLWKVNNTYFDSLQEAMDYIYGTTKGINNSKAIEDVPITRTAVLQRNVHNGERGGGLIVPADFEGQLVIDFNGFTYEFDNSLDHFFDVRGGDEVYIFNGTTVIYNEADHEPYALAVNTDTVTIDEHLIDDRRVEDDNHPEGAKLFDVGTNGSLVVTNTSSSSETGATLTGIISIATDGTENGGKIQITNSNLVITNIFTTYQDSEGNIHPNIPDVYVSEKAKSEINILSGNIEILNINQGTDYKEGDTLYKKAVLNIIKADPENPERDTKVSNPHKIDTIIEAVVDSVKDPTKKADKEVIHDLYDDWTTETAPGYPATCTTAGLEVRWCHSAMCDIDGHGTHYHEEKVVRALGHLITTGWITTDPVTHWHVCDRCGEKVGEEAHSFSEWTYDPVSGQSERDCSVCERHETETHVHSLTYVPRVPHTAKTAGNIEYWYCTVCNKKYKDAAGTIQVTDVTDPHVTEHHDAVPHTCTESGIKEHWECTICHLYFEDKAATIPITDIVDPAAHSLSYVAQVSATCTSTGTLAHYKCTVCDKLFSDSAGEHEVSANDLVIAKIAHSVGTTWETSADGHYKECSVCGNHIDENGEIVSGYAAHTINETVWKNVSATQHAHECSICGYESGHTEHTLVYGDWISDGHGGSYRTVSCSANGCDYTYQDIEAHTHSENLTHHSAVAATCEEAGKIEYWLCSCGKYFSDSSATNEITQAQTVVNAAGHTIVTHNEVAATCTTAGNPQYWTCSVCNQIFTINNGDGTYSGKVSTPPVTSALGHDMGEWSTTLSPTCTVAGEMRRDCSRCDHYETQAISPLGHNMGEWTTTISPTCTEAGEEKRYCSRCDYSETRETDPLGHNWSTAWSTDGTHHWHACQNSGCTAVNNKAEHTYEFYYSFDGEILEIYHKCNVCMKQAPSTEYHHEEGVFHLTYVDGMTVTVEKSTGNVTVAMTRSEISYNYLKWYDINGKEITELGTGKTSFTFNSEGRFGFRCDKFDTSGHRVDSCYTQFTKYND